MLNSQSDLIVNRPMEQVFNFATDVARYDDWTDMSGTHLVSGGNLRVGSKIETTIHMGPIKQTMVFEVTALEENRRFGLKKVSKGAMEMEGRWTLEPQGGSSTRVIHSVQVGLNGLLRLLEPLMAGKARSTEAKEMAKFKELVEGGN